MSIKLVVLDLDGTLWDHPDVSVLIPPFRRLDNDSAEDTEGRMVRLYAGMRELIEELDRRGVLLSIASWNKPEPVYELLKLFELDSFFRHPMVQFHPDKDRMVRELLAKLEKEGVDVKPEEILYVDDHDWHLAEIKETVGLVNFLHMWKDVNSPLKILDHI